MDIGDLNEKEVSQTIMQQGMYQDGTALSSGRREFFNSALDYFQI